MTRRLSGLFIAPCSGRAADCCGLSEKKWGKVAVGDSQRMTRQTQPGRVAWGMRLAPALLTAVAILAASPAAVPASAITGSATVTDGDTIKINGERIRLEGIDAPETHQTCKDAGGRNYDCGVVSTAALRAHISSSLSAATRRARTVTAGPWPSASSAPRI